MKKFLTMFAFAAAIVFGAFALASCSSDDDELNVKHKFTYLAMLNSDNADTRDNTAFKQKQQTLKILSEIGEQTFTATDKEAKVTWEEFKVKYEDKLLDEVKVLCEEFDDDQIYFKITISRDGMRWEELVCKYIQE